MTNRSFLLVLLLIVVLALGIARGGPALGQWCSGGEILVGVGILVATWRDATRSDARADLCDRVTR